jgi:hypothetical protein
LALIVLLLAAAQGAAAQRSIDEPFFDRNPPEELRHEDGGTIRPDGGSVTYQQWTMLVVLETAPNAIPVSAPGYGDTSAPCTYSQSSSPTYACYNPLKIEFDVALPANFTISTSSSSPTTVPIASLAGTGPSNLLVLTNSVDSTDGGVTSMSIQVYCSGTTLQLTLNTTNEDGSTFQTIGGLGSSTSCSLSGTITGFLEVSTGDIGLFMLTPQNVISGAYLGNFGDAGVSFGATGNSQFTSTVNSDFTASGTVTVAANQLCGAQTSPLTLSSASGLAQANGVAPGIVGISIGDTLELAASNSTTLIWFVASDVDTLGNALPAGTIFLTGYVVSGVCAGTYFYDAPFQTHMPRVHHEPRPRRYPAFVHPQWRLVFRD